MKKIIVVTLISLTLPFCLLAEIVREVLSTLYYCAINEVRYLPRNIGNAWRKTFCSLRDIWQWCLIANKGGTR